MATFQHLWETFPDENCVLRNRELLLLLEASSWRRHSLMVGLIFGETC